jgi:LacI family transcriptional regulator
VEYFFGLKEIPDAVFAAEDFSALGIIKGLKDRKVNMPNDFGVIGFANETFGEHISPSLSSVDLQTVEMGKTAAGLLIKMINSSKTETIQKIQDIILEPLLKIRESTAVNLAL